MESVQTVEENEADDRVALRNQAAAMAKNNGKLPGPDRDLYYELRAQAKDQPDAFRDRTLTGVDVVRLGTKASEILSLQSGMKQGLEAAKTPLLTKKDAPYAYAIFEQAGVSGGAWPWSDTDNEAMNRHFRMLDEVSYPYRMGDGTGPARALTPDEERTFANLVLQETKDMGWFLDGDKDIVDMKPEDLREWGKMVKEGKATDVPLELREIVRARVESHPAIKSAAFESDEQRKATIEAAVRLECGEMLIKAGDYAEKNRR